MICKQIYLTCRWLTNRYYNLDQNGFENSGHKGFWFGLVWFSFMAYQLLLAI